MLSLIGGAPPYDPWIFITPKNIHCSSCLLSFQLPLICSCSLLYDTVPSYPSQEIKKESWILTEEGEKYASSASPEVQLFEAIPPEGIRQDELEVS